MTKMTKMTKMIKKSKMNDTQLYMLNEQYKDRISPCVKEILEKATFTERQEVCSYLILMALKGSLDQNQYASLLTEYLGDSSKQRWVHERLISLNGVFQPSNDKHLFIKFLIDERFYNATSGISKEEWVHSCKKIITSYYSDKIHAEINSWYPNIYEKVFNKINADFELRTPDSSCKINM